MMRWKGWVLGLSVIAAPAGAVDLLSIYDLARENDTSRASAQAAAGAADARYRQARGALLPNISANASVGKTRQKQRFEGAPEGGFGFGGDDEEEDFEDQQSVSISLSQPLFDWSAWQAKSAAADRHEAALAELGSAEQQLMTDVVDRYFTVLAARDSLDAAGQQLELIERQLDRSEAEFEAGIRPITDQQEAASQMDAARVEQLTARNQLARARASLAELTARPPGQLAMLPVPDELPAPSQSASEWVAVAVGNSPAVAAAASQLAAAERDIRRARGGHYPNLDLVGRVGETEQVVNFPVPGAGSTEFNSVTETQSVALELSLPLFAGGATSAAVSEAEFSREQARQSLIAARRQAELFVRTAHGDLETAAARVVALKSSIASAATAVEAAQAGIQTGTRNILDLLEAEFELLDRKTRLRQAVYDYFNADFRLRRSAGVLDTQILLALNARLHSPVNPDASSTGRGN